MKYFLFVFVFLLSVSFVSAQNLELLDNSYVTGETVQAYVHNTTSLSASQISLLYEDDSIVSFSPLFLEYDDDQYFLYFDLDSDLAEGDYRLFVGSFQDNFSLESSSSSIRVKPAIVLLDESSSSFFVTLTSVFGEESVQISSSDAAIVPRKSVTSVDSAGFDLYVDYDYDTVLDDAILSLVYGTSSYDVPLIYPEDVVSVNESVVNETVVNETVSNETVVNETIVNETESDERVALAFLVAMDAVEIEIAPDQSLEDTLVVANQLNETLEDLTFSFTGNLGSVLFVEPSSVSTLASGENVSVTLFLNQDLRATEGLYEGELVFGNDEYFVSLPFFVTIAAEAEVIDDVIEEDLDDDDDIITFDGDSSGDESESSSSGAIVVGFIIILLLSVLILFVYLKMRAKEKKQFDQYIEETKRK